MNHRVVCTEIKSPLGDLLLTGEEGALTGLYLAGHPRAPEIKDDWTRAAEPFAEAERQLAAYFSGELREFDLALELRGTAFQRAVWEALGTIPYGETVSYGELARRLGRPRAARAVGAANGSNPVSIVVPCHRVIGAGRALTGYAWGLERKRWLLELEQAFAAGAPGPGA